MVLRGETLKLFRCVALEEVTEEEILAVLQPTFCLRRGRTGRSGGKTDAVRIPLRRALRVAPRKKICCSSAFGVAGSLQRRTAGLSGRGAQLT